MYTRSGPLIPQDRLQRPARRCSGRAARSSVSRWQSSGSTPAPTAPRTRTRPAPTLRTGCAAPSGGFRCAPREGSRRSPCTSTRTRSTRTTRAITSPRGSRLSLISARVAPRRWCCQSWATPQVIHARSTQPAAPHHSRRPGLGPWLGHQHCRSLAVRVPLEAPLAHLQPPHAAMYATHGAGRAQPRDASEQPACSGGAFVSYPVPGKHLAFDGRLLHGAIEELAPPPAGGPAGPYTRVTLMVNVWVDHRPARCARTTRPPARTARAHHAAKRGTPAAARPTRPARHARHGTNSRLSRPGRTSHQLRHTPTARLDDTRARLESLSALACLPPARQPAARQPTARPSGCAEPSAFPRSSRRPSPTST